MTCPYCAKPIEEGVQMCPHCGAMLPKEVMTEAEPAEQTPVTEEANAAAANKRGRLLRVLGGVIGGVAVAAVLAVVAVTLLAPPSLKVEWALEKSLSAYSSMLEDIGPDFDVDAEEALTQSIKITPHMSGIPAEQTPSLALKLRNDPEARRAEMEMRLQYIEQFSLKLAVNDALFGMSSDDLTDGNWYGVNTETLGADLQQFGIPAEYQTLSFNLFDLITTVRAWSEESGKDAEDALKELLDSVVTEEAGSDEREINGYDREGTVYEITVPNAALRRFVNALNDSSNTVELYKHLLRDMGIRNIGGMTVDELFAQQAETPDLLEGWTDDIRLTAFVADGYLMELATELSAEGMPVRLSLQMGGGDCFEDDLSLKAETMVGDGASTVMELSSSGDHTAAAGYFTDTLRMRVYSGEYTMMDVKVKTVYDPREEEDNFSATLLGAEQMGMEMKIEGTVSAENDRLLCDLDLIVKAAGAAEETRIGVEVEIKEGATMEMDAADVKLLTQMSEQELQNLMVSIQQKLSAWSGAGVAPESFYGSAI